MNKPENWRGGRRTRPITERIAHAHHKFAWHFEQAALARGAGNHALAKRHQGAANQARRHRDDLVLEQQWRKDNEILGG